MLQDLEYGRLENEDRPLPPLDSDYVLCFRGQDVLLRRSPDNTLSLPTVALVRKEVYYGKLHYVKRTKN